MEINKYIFRGYDIRGISGEDLTKETVTAIGKAFGTFLRQRKIYQTTVGMDNRLRGEEFKKYFIDGITSTGTNVIDIGYAMTQTVYFSQYFFQSNGGAMITASHNPANYNGFKLGAKYSETIVGEEVQELRRMVEEERFFVAEKKGKVEKIDISKDYAKDLLKRINLKKKMKVVVNPRHGITGKFIPDILRQAGCEVIEMNSKLDGSYPKGVPDPTGKDFLEETAEKVLAEKADVGFAFDGDGDRIGVVDEKGKIMWNDELIAILAQEILERLPGEGIVFNDLCSQLVKEIILKNGGKPFIWRTGHGFIKQKMAETGAVFGGELSGHFFCADSFFKHDDGTFIGLRILEYLTEKGRTLSEIRADFPQYMSSPEIKIGCPDDKKIEVMDNITKKFKNDFSDAEIIDKLIIPGSDGVRAGFKDGMIIIRYSQNGPYITVKFEAKDEDTYEDRKKYVRDMLESYPEIIWEGKMAVNLDSLVD